MTVAELVEKLLDFDGDEEISFYYLKDNILTNSRLEDINSYGMGVEFTVQDTYEFMEENSRVYLNKSKSKYLTSTS